MANILIGKTLTGVMIAEDKEALLFKTPESEIKAKCDADCCSHTWIEHVELPVNGFPAVVSSVEDLELNAGLDTRDGEMAYYGCKIVTDKGDIIIDYRNESDGYYGGRLWFPDEDDKAYNRFYGGVHGAECFQ